MDTYSQGQCDSMLAGNSFLARLTHKLAAPGVRVWQEGILHGQDARGDQCDQCGNLLNPTELIKPRCKLTGTTPVLRETRHVFLDLPALTPRLQHYIDHTSRLGGWSSNCVQACHSPKYCPYLGDVFVSSIACSKSVPHWDAGKLERPFTLTCPSSILCAPWSGLEHLTPQS